MVELLRLRIKRASGERVDDLCSVVVGPGALILGEPYIDACFLAGCSGTRPPDCCTSPSSNSSTLGRLQLYEATGKKNEADKWRELQDEAKNAAAKAASKK